MKRTLTVIGVALLFLTLTAQRFKPSTGGLQEASGATLISPIQGVALKNAESTSATNTAQTDSIAAVTGQSVYLYAVSVRCSAGTATLTIKDGVGGTAIWSAAAETSTTAPASNRIFWHPPLTSTSGNGMDIVVGACGTSNTSTLDVQASQF